MVKLREPIIEDFRGNRLPTKHSEKHEEFRTFMEILRTAQGLEIQKKPLVYGEVTIVQGFDNPFYRPDTFDNQ